MLVVFDLDGVIIDSADAVRESYRAAGVEAPTDVLAYEGVGWIADQLGPNPMSTEAEVRALKNAAYVAAMRTVPTLPPLVVAQRLARNGNEVGLLTGAPRGTVDMLRTRFTVQPHAINYWPFAWWLDDIRTPAKMVFLAAAGGTRACVYVDDQARLVRVPDGWRFIHYRRQSVSVLYDEITGAVQMRSTASAVGREESRD